MTPEPIDPIDPIDPGDERALREWWEVSHAAHAERRHDFYPPWETSRVALPRTSDDWTLTLTLARDAAGGPVGSGFLQLPLSDNTHLAHLEVCVAPGHRRRGVGSAVLADLERRAAEAGRGRLLGSAPGPDGEASASYRFALARGFRVALAEEHKVLDLRAAAPRWAALQREVDAAIGDHRIVVWTDATPDDLVEGHVALLDRVNDLVPVGDSGLEAGGWTVERLRAAEQRRRDIGTLAVTAGAVAPDGVLVGVSDVRVRQGAPRIADVGVTAVLPGHRGRRLGLALKLAQHRALIAASPETELLATYNADVNAPMNAINERLGYEVVEHSYDLVKEIGAEGPGARDPD